MLHQNQASSNLSAQCNNTAVIISLANELGEEKIMRTDLALLGDMTTSWMLCIGLLPADIASGGAVLSYAKATLFRTPEHKKKK